MCFLHLVRKIVGEEYEDQNQESPSLVDANHESPGEDVVDEDYHHVGKNPDPWKISKCAIIFFLLPEDHVRAWFWVWSPLIPLHEESPTGPVREGQERDTDADFLRDASVVSCAKDDVQLKE